MDDLVSVIPAEVDLRSGESSFAERHLGIAERDLRAMLQTLGVSSLEQLIAQAMPAAVLDRGPIGLPAPLSEPEMLRRLAEIAGRNTVRRAMIGLGYYDCITPAVIRRNLFENPGWYTAYTPYQPEISQGRLELLFNFQTMVSELCGLDIANASMLDEASAAAEAMTMAKRVAGSRRAAFFVAASCHPQIIAVVRTRAEPLGIEIIVGDPLRDIDPAQVFGALVQFPHSLGGIEDYGS